MENVKLNVTDTIQISELINATSVVSGRSIKDVTKMMHQDGLMYGAVLDLRRSYWRVGDWFDDALKHLLICNRLSKLPIVKDSY